jgi:hypothetical protein
LIFEGYIGMSKSKKEKKDKSSKKLKKQKSIKKEKPNPKSPKSSDRTSSNNSSHAAVSVPIIKDEPMAVPKEEMKSKVLVKFKSTKRTRCINQGKVRLYPLIECYDSDDVVTFDPSTVTQDPGTVYEAASQIFTRINYTQKHLDLVYKRSSDLLKSLEFFCKA